MAEASTVRRHPDGALDIGYHRRRAARLRRMALRQPRRRRLGLLVAVGLFLGGAALAEPEPTHGSEVLEMTTRPDGRIFRLVTLMLAPGAETARHAMSGEALVLVVEGTVTRDVGAGQPTTHRPGEVFDGGAMQVLRNPGPAPARLMQASIAAAGEPPARPASFSE